MLLWWRAEKLLRGFEGNFELLGGPVPVSTVGECIDKMTGGNYPTGRKPGEMKKTINAKRNNVVEMPRAQAPTQYAYAA